MEALNKWQQKRMDEAEEAKSKFYLETGYVSKKKRKRKSGAEALNKVLLEKVIHTSE
jgi:hypothetical protein